MSGIIASIGHNLAGLAHFSGRDTRRQFWPYAIFLFILAMIAVLMLVMSVVLDMFLRVQKFAVEHPEGFPTNPATGPYDPSMQSFPPELMPNFSAMIVPMMVVNAVGILLIAAAVTRRLHDRDMTGLWGLMPVPFMAFGALLGPKAFSTFDAASPPNSLIFAALALNNALSFGAFIALVVILVGEGTKAPNRYGAEPVPTA